VNYWDTFDRDFEFEDPNATTQYARHCLQVATEFRQRVLDWEDPQTRRGGDAPGLFSALQAGFLTYAALDLIRLRAGRKSLLPACERIFTQARRQGTVTGWNGKTFANAHAAAAETGHCMYLLVRESAPLTTDDLRRLCAGFTVSPYAHEDTRWLSDRLVAARDKLRDVSIQLPELPDLYAEIEWEAVQAAATPDGTPLARHSADFRSVHWYGTYYTFTSAQAACVKVLWQAWKNGTSEIAQDTILDEIDAAGNRLIDLFRDRNSESGYHPAWGTMIVSGSTKGSFCLNPPKK
jgi:hypothetical protein